MTYFAQLVKNKLNAEGMKQKDLIEKVGEFYDGNLNSVVISLAVNGEDNVYPKVKLAIARALKLQF